MQFLRVPPPFCDRIIRISRMNKFLVDLSSIKLCQRIENSGPRFLYLHRKSCLRNLDDDLIQRRFIMLRSETVGSLKDDPLVCYSLIQPSEIIFLFGFHLVCICSVSLCAWLLWSSNLSSIFSQIGRTLRNLVAKAIRWTDIRFQWEACGRQAKMLLRKRY